MRATETVSPNILLGLAVSDVMQWLRQRFSSATHMVFLSHKMIEGQTLEVTVTRRDTRLEKSFVVDLSSHLDARIEGGLDKVSLYSALEASVQSQL